MPVPENPAASSDAGPRVPDRRHPDRQELRADGRRMLTVAEVALHLNCTAETVRKLIRAGALRSVQYSARVTRVPEQSVVAFLSR